jgi:hypothetical protein
MEPALSNCLIPMAFDRPEIEPFSIYAINDAVGVRITSRSRPRKNLQASRRGKEYLGLS